MKILRLVNLFLALLLAVPRIANADIIDFTGINQTAVTSLSGQIFAYTNGSGGATGTVTVLQIAGTPSAVQTGQAPDTTGFYALQYGNDLTPMVFRFTFDVPRSFTITQNEQQANLEVNSFILPSGAWNVVSMAYTIPTTNGSNLTFVGQNGSPPYGTFVISGTGASFDFGITNAPGYPEYGSAISINVGPITPVGPAVGPAVAISLAVRLQWQSESGKTYQPQYSFDLNTNLWTNFGPTLPGTGQVMELFDSNDSGPQKFYRILTL